MRETSDSLSAARSKVLTAERRMRVNRALDAGTTGLSVALGLAVLALAARKTGLLGELPARVVLAGLALGVVVVTVVALARRLAPLAGARRLDAHHGLSGRLANALAFSSEAAGDAWRGLAIADGARAAQGADPRGAVPLRRPHHLGVAGALIAPLVLVALFEVRARVPWVAADRLDPAELSADDLDAMREFATEMEQKQPSEETRELLREFNQLVDDLAKQRLDRTEAFRKLENLEQKMLEGKEADKKALEEALKKLGDDLKKAELGKPTGEALGAMDLAAAEKNLRELAQKLRDQKPDKAQLDKLRQALKEARENRDKSKAEVEKKREELQKELLKNKEQQKNTKSEEEKSLLKKKERELERLSREEQKKSEAERRLERLDRELQEAAEDLAKDLGLSADDLEQSAEDINRMAREQMSEKEKQDLKQKLDELRAMLRQQSGQGGKARLVRLQKFGERARGQQGQGQQPPPGQQGQEQQGQGQQGQGQQGQGQQGQGQQGQGQQGQGQQGQGQGQGETWVLGPNGEKLMMLSKQSGGGQGQGEGGGKGGQGAGTEHDGNLKGQASKAVGGTTDSQVQGQDTANGQTRSEVILGAAERGFASKGYQKVFREYETVAEEALNQDEIPDGYRFYVRRYFQLIRPRDGEAALPVATP